MNNRVRKLREYFGLSQRQFADKLGVSANFVFMLEKGERNPSPRTIGDICRLFGIERDWLEHGIGSMLVPQTSEEELVAVVAEKLPTLSPEIQARWASLFTKLSTSQLDALADTAEALLLKWKE